MMKWLIFMTLLAACGKHEQPKSVDMQDNDGDQILNFQENGIEKEFAQVPLVGKVKGVLRVYADAIVDLPLNNTISSQTALDNIVRLEKKAKVEEHFSEWSFLNITKRALSFQKTNLEMVKFEILLEADSDKGGILYLIRDGSIEKLTELTRTEFKSSLNRQTILDLASGKLKLYLAKRFSNSPDFKEDARDSIKQKTYRIYYNDGKKDSVLYVAKHIHPEQLFEKLNIKPAIVIESELFINSSLDTRWYYREFNNGEKALVLAKGKDLRNKYLEQFHYQKFILKRENGLSKAKESLNNFAGATIYMRAKPVEKITRTFSEGVSTKNYAYGGPDNLDTWSCHHYLRKVLKEVSEMVPVYDELVDLKITPTNDQHVLKMYPMNLTDEEGIIYEAGTLDYSEANLQIDLKSMHESSFVTTGEYRTDCGRHGRLRKLDAAYTTNFEAKMSMILETFVEKTEL